MAENPFQVLSGLKCNFEVPETTDETGYRSNVLLKWGHDQHLGKRKKDRQTDRQTDRQKQTNNRKPKNPDVNMEL
jgi:hypothetical protein